MDGFTPTVLVRAHPMLYPLVHKLMCRLVWSSLVFLCLSGPLLAAADYDALQKAQALYDQGEIKAAIIEFKNVLQLDPGHVDARVRLADSYLKLGDGAAAEKETERLRKLRTKRELWIESYGRALLLQRKFDRVLEQIEVEDRDAPEIRAVVLSVRGEAYGGLGQDDSAREHFAKALEGTPKSASAMLGLAKLLARNGEYDLAIKYAEEVLQADQKSLQASLLIAESYRVQDQLVEAIVAFDRSLMIAPDSMPALLGKASTHISAREFEQAQAPVDHLLRLNSNIIPANYMHGLLALQRKEVEVAEVSLLKVLNAAPEDLRTHLLLGTIQYGRGSFEAARDHIGRFVVARPDHFPSIRMMAGIHLRLNEPLKAIHLLESVSEGNLDNAQYLALLGSAYLRTGDYALGNEYLEKAIELEPDMAVLRAQLALGRMATGESGSAVEALQEAVDLGQNLIQADVLLILAHLKQKHYDEALIAAQALIQKHPESPVPHNLLGAAYLVQHQLDDAKTSFQAALGIDEGFHTAHLNLAAIAVRTGDLDVAESHYQRVLKGLAGSERALMGLAQVALRRGHQQEMLKWVQAAHDVHPESASAATLLIQSQLKSGEVLKALVVARAFSDAAPKSMAATRLLGVALLANDKFSSALTHFTTYSDSAPDIAEPWYMRAEAEWKSGDMAAARLHIERALFIEPGSFPGLLLATRISAADNRLENALVHAGSLIERFPESAQGYKLKGSILQRMKRPIDGLNAYLQGYEVTPNQDLAHAAYRALIQVQRRDDAYALMRGWVQNHPDDRGGLMVLAMGLQGDGKDDEAIATYEQLRAVDPDNIIMLNNLAWMYNDRNDPRAIDVAEHAYQQDPEKSAVADTFGWVLVSQGQVERGLVVLQEASIRSPYLYDIRYHLAVAYDKVGRRQEARKELVRLLRDAKDFPLRKDATSMLEKIK
ncbi:MAG TPA: PEP-CTERM system TPR-repeat protein PrsT [Chromatiales bacterium]|jgi:putative PEP-CTERM system TPR-repeat lipoprotein|nr:PEP-CTERM system TPR-repeat protein PrsT [Chromatiales bacterium]